MKKRELSRPTAIWRDKKEDEEDRVPRAKDKQNNCAINMKEKPDSAANGKQGINPSTSMTEKEKKKPIVIVP